jgi:uncharacterized protein with FMN-binding domain
VAVSARHRAQDRTGRGRTIAVAGIATVGGVAALLAYHTSQGPTAALADQAMPAHPQGTAAAMAGPVATSPVPQGRAGGNAMAGSASVPGRNGTATTGMGTSAGTMSGARTVTGTAAGTSWGIVQVRITVQGGKVTSASTVQSPHSVQHSLDINQYAVPILNREAVQAGTAKIDAVSGATITSGGYLQSLQSALDLAHA